ncbi:MAG: type II toxin-antitoxin system RelE/ParE family toxin [Bacteroidetes bacterium]|nr:MAG: type II toxin-antitoxin system RelE/ParE family toxin [Bacteroidota bacterium]
MAKIKIIWSRKAKKKLYSFLDFYIRESKSKSFSINLYKMISKEIKLLRKHPYQGMKTNDESILGFIIDSFIIYYELTDNHVAIHSVCEWPQKPDH